MVPISLAAVPTPADVLRDPSLADALPPHALAALYGDVAALEARLRTRLLLLGITAESSTASAADRLLLIEEAAKMLATSEDTLYSKWKKLPFAFKDPLDGRIKFRVSGIERYITSRTSRVAS
jgi:predicted DNA-binding transcriptional regulator AlpA